MPGMWAPVPRMPRPTTPTRISALAPQACEETTSGRPNDAADAPWINRLRLIDMAHLLRTKTLLR